MEIRDIKAHLSILAVLSSYQLKPNRNNMLPCPFHEDKAPSLKIYTNTNTFNCFGCGANGDTIEFIQQKEKCSKHEAIIKAKSLANINETVPPMKQENQKDKNLLPRIAVLSKVAQDSKASFKRTANAKDYIRSRKLDPDKMEVGYIGTDFGKTWNKQLQESGLQLGVLTESRQNTIVPKFKNCVLFFTKNEKGQIIDIYGRSINPNGEGKHFYLNGKHQGIYPNYPNAKTTKLILTEAIIDCATLEQQTEIKEHYTILSLYGTNGFTDEMEEAIKELPELEETILFFDGDKAGNEAAIRTAEKLKAINPKLTITKVETPEGEDINSLLQGHEPEILNHLINERKPISDKKEKQGNDTEAPPEPEPVGNLNTNNPDKITYQEGELQFIIWGGIEK